jgi:hypothetical protein
MKIIKLYKGVNMKKLIIGSLALIGVAALIFGAVGMASAQGQERNESNDYDPNGPMHGEGNFGDGVLHDYMFQAMADSLGISVDDLSSRIEDGETSYQIALDLGFSEEEIFELMSTARDATIDQALADGVITQEEAEQLRERGGHHRIFNGEGEMPFGQGHHGQGGRNGDCLFDQDDE